MAIFRANIVNLVGYGEKITRKRGGGFTRDKYVLALGPHRVTIKQRVRALKLDGNNARGRQIDSSYVTVTNIRSMTEGMELVQDLCWLLSFGTQSAVMPYEFRLGRQRQYRPASGTCNGWRRPFHSGIGKLSDFVEQAWPNYQALKATWPLPHFIHMVDESDVRDGLLEVKVAITMQCLESIKSYFALIEGSRYGIRETAGGEFVDAANRKQHFEPLLRRTLNEVGMTLPASFGRIRRLRNALIHRGFIRESDTVTRHIFGPLSPGAMHTAMFEVMEDAQDILREYLLRLLGYRGRFCTYSNSGMGERSIP